MKYLHAFEQLMLRHEASPKPDRPALLPAMEAAATWAFAEMVALEDDMTLKRNWLDSHRNDPRHARRKAKFEQTEVLNHQKYLEAFERYGDLAGERAVSRYVERIEKHDPDGTAVHPDRGEGAANRVSGRSDTENDPVAGREQAAPPAHEARRNSLSARMRAEQTGS